MMFYDSHSYNVSQTINLCVSPIVFAVQSVGREIICLELLNLEENTGTECYHESNELVFIFQSLDCLLDYLSSGTSHQI